MVSALLLAGLAGCVLTLLLLQLLLAFRRPAPPPPPPPPAAGRSVQADAALRDYLAGTSGPESCHFLNAIFLFLFRELRDTAVLRRWLLRKIRVELEELLLSRTAGRLLEGLSLRELSLGDAVPVLRGVRLLPPEPRDDSALPPELSFELEAEYGGGLRLAVDVELLFGKSASLSVRLGRVQGRVRLVFSRLPFTHWAFCFTDEPLMDFQVHSQFEGRPLPQLTSIIITQLKRVIRRKHTLPHYKIRPNTPPEIAKPPDRTPAAADVHHHHPAEEGDPEKAHPAALQDQLTSIIITQLKRVIRRKHTLPHYKIRRNPQTIPLPQLTSIIITQLKRVIRRKHTLPHYKIRYKPFFPMQVVPAAEDVEDRTLTLQDLGLAEGRLKVSVMDCSRLLIFGSYDQETFIHCTLEISGAPWREKSRSSIKT
ncbi:PDZ domain-containing protein 8, partial [Anomaloglossus baeobatrachus]